MWMLMLLLMWALWWSVDWGGEFQLAKVEEGIEVKTGGGNNAPQLKRSAQVVRGTESEASNRR